MGRDGKREKRWSMGPIDRRKSAAWPNVNVAGLGRAGEGGKEAGGRGREIRSKIADGRTWSRPRIEQEETQETRLVNDHFL